MVVTHQHVMDEARRYLGVRFRHLGRTRQSGLDCFGLVIRVCWDLQLSQLVFDAYAREPNPAVLRAGCDREMIRTYAPVAGDVVLMTGGRWPCHLAILGDKAEPFSLIHAYAEAECVCENGIGAYLKAHNVIGYYHLPHVEEH